MNIKIHKKNFNFFGNYINFRFVKILIFFKSVLIVQLKIIYFCDLYEDRRAQTCISRGSFNTFGPNFNKTCIDMFTKLKCINN
jgi:hypothetical protein